MRELHDPWNDQCLNDNNCSRYSYGGPVSSLRISDDEIVSDGHCLSISDAIGRRLRDGDKIRYKLKLSERGERH